MNILRSVRVRVAVLVVIAIAMLSVTIMWMREDPPPATAQIETPERIWAINRSETIGGITVTLSEVRDREGVIGIEHSFTIDRQGLDRADILHLGFPTITRPDGTVVDAHAAIPDSPVNRTSEIAYFDLTSKYPGDDELFDVDIGWFVVPRPDVSGTAKIELGTEYAAAIRNGDKEIDISLNSQFVAGAGEYRATKLSMLRGMRGGTTFKIIIVPVNDAAKKIAVASIGPVEITLTDNLGNSYSIIGAGSTPADSPDSVAIESQEIDFQGEIAMEASTLTLNFKGGGEIVGPFVFGAVGLVSEDIERSGTPVTPGDADGEDGPTGIVNDPTPTAAPTSTPSPTSQNNP